jgi:hypothetical protein
MLIHNCISIRRILTQMRCHRTKIMKLSSLELRHLQKQFLTVSPPPLAIQLPLSQLLLCSPHKSLVLLQTNSAFRAEGMRIIDPGGKSISRPKSHNVRCSPRRRPKTPQYPLPWPFSQTLFSQALEANPVVRQQRTSGSSKLVSELIPG